MEDPNPTDTARAEGSPVPSPGGGGASQEEPAPGEPHGALFLVLRYLRLQELLSFHRVCRLLRDAVADDTSLWRDVVVEPPLSGKVTDGILVEVASRAGGRLRTLALVNCWKVTDAGLQRVVDENPGIVKLHVPGCSYITADAVVKAVRTLVLGQRKGSCALELQVRLNGVSHITKEHLDVLRSILGVRHQLPSFYSDWCSQTFNSNSKDDRRPIDVDICPKCVSPRLVFDCTRLTCRLLKGHRGWSECRGCIFCIPRCGDCGGCVGLRELGEESACSHLLCLECWLRFPKCNICNRPYCTKHMSNKTTTTTSQYYDDLQTCSNYSKILVPAAGFICQECQRHEDYLLFDGDDQQEL